MPRERTYNFALITAYRYHHKTATSLSESTYGRKSSVAWVSLSLPKNNNEKENVLCMDEAAIAIYAVLRDLCISATKYRYPSYFLAPEVDDIVFSEIRVAAG